MQTRRESVATTAGDCDVLGDSVRGPRRQRCAGERAVTRAGRRGRCAARSGTKAPGSAWHRRGNPGAFAGRKKRSPTASLFAVEKPGDRE